MSESPTRPAWLIEQRGTDTVLQIRGDWVATETGVRDPSVAHQVIAEAPTAKRLHIDASALGRWDSALIVFLQQLQRAGSGRADIDVSGLPDAVKKLLALAAEAEPGVPGPERRDPLVTRVGQGVLSLQAQSAAVCELVGETVLRGAAAFIGRTRSRAIDVLHLMRDAGPGALVIVAIVNGLVGAILAFVGAVQLRRFGADIFVADLVGIALVRELAAVMTAIVMAGRTGGAFAAHIATMQGNEEIDALKALGIPVFDYLVLPRVTALIAMMPLLYFYACALGLLGGLIVSVSVLDITVTGYLEETRRAIAGRQFAIGLGKSIAFGALVALASCHIGLRAGRSAADVGRAATSAVVIAIIGIIALDAVFAVCANALGI